MSYATESDVNNLLNTINSSVTFVKGQIIINYMTYDDVTNGSYHIYSSVHRRPIEMTDKFWGRDGYIIDNKIPYAFLGRDDVITVGVLRV